jgi:hypothetical protein
MSWKTNGHLEVCTPATNSMPIFRRKWRSRRRTFLKRCCQFFGGSVSPPARWKQFRKFVWKKSGAEAWSSTVSCLESPMWNFKINCYCNSPQDWTFHNSWFTISKVGGTSVQPKFVISLSSIELGISECLSSCSRNIKVIPARDIDKSPQHKR